MATLETICFQPTKIEISGNKIEYIATAKQPVLMGMPQIFWADNTPWREANLWAIERVTNGEVKIKTASSNMNGLLNYAKFLEKAELKWFEFPIRKSERCLVLYRAKLIDLRDQGQLSPSSVSEYMRICIMFYRWLKDKGLVSSDLQLWQDKQYEVKYFNEVGFERTISVLTTDLHIPNRKPIGEFLEGGLLPVSNSIRDSILDFAKSNSSMELHFMLALGFFTGMRLGSICDLKISTLERAVPDSQVTGLLLMAIGPGASPPVHTKFGVTGHVWIPAILRDVLLDYAKSLRRAYRENKSSPENRDLLFLTRYGNS